MNNYIICGDLQAKQQNLEECALLFQKVESLAKEKNLNKVIWLGDMLDRRGLIESQCLNVLFDYFSSSELYHYIVVGNHDLLNLHGSDHALEPLKALKNVNIYDKPGQLGKLLFVPYMRNSKKFLEAIEYWVPKMPKAPILICHQGIKEFTIGSGYTEDEAVGVDQVKQFKLVVAGHYHCFSDDTEVLTKEGWRTYDKIAIGDMAMTFNIEKNELEYNKIKNLVIKQVDEEVINIKSKVIDFIVTKDHRVLYYQNDQYYYDLAKNTPIRQTKIPQARQFKNVGLNISDDMLQLLVWISADGSLEQGACRFHLRKQRKIQRLVNLLERLSIKYSIYLQKTGNTKIRICKDAFSPILTAYYLKNKQLPTIFRKLSREQFLVLLEELSHTDGNKTGPNGNIQWSSTHKTEIDMIQELCALNGMRSSVYVRHYINKAHKPLNIINIIPLMADTSLVKANFKTTHYRGIVWCPTVVNSNIVVRRNGKVAIMGNCPMERENVVYLGSPFSHSFGESNEHKRLGILDTETSIIEFIPTDFRRHVSIEINLDNFDFDGIINYDSKDLTRAIITGTEDQIEKFKLGSKFNSTNLKFIYRPTSTASSVLIQDTLTNKEKWLKWSKEVKQFDDTIINAGLDLL